MGRIIHELRHGDKPDGKKHLRPNVKEFRCDSEKTDIETTCPAGTKKYEKVRLLAGRVGIGANIRINGGGRGDHW
jgi:hypothetical protein